MYIFLPIPYAHGAPKANEVIIYYGHEPSVIELKKRFGGIKVGIFNY